MAQFNNWCISVDQPVGNHHRRVMTGQAGNLAVGIQATAAIVPAHYASEEQMARALARLGKPMAAALIEGKLPTTKQIRSGDLGEIYATEWIDAHSGGYRAPIKRLRWKDHRNMAMRGDDVIGILQDAQSQRLHFLKTEAKSRAALTAQVLTDARAGLDKDGGLPSAHALSFISARLLELHNLPLADAIDDALLKHGIPPQNVKHLLFTFSGNAPDALLTTSLQAYPGSINQWGIGLRVEGHAAFIGAVYDRVIANANNP
ncbi:Hachiman antiphage defense system protein HamA [Aureimonas ureilytica]|uniref:Hachiman antiphage defense system protein HamA n=1 Tax=Aureimonas ureilytica TaxID=401562 RepID=UPI00039BBA92|nr:Hachiman antiphage defense system protein HamA [Aureimonas ureilytica]